ncbi:tetratricopeptide repeat protein [Phaeovulum sp. W22_SRMD_FR3]|uniref:tetratricopeptide repeat protein n=1 Tax=Phaeovulum sp. W22_SRMD_FR3 TaxID=3240274 RepID=UPI003F98DA3B
MKHLLVSALLTSVALAVPAGVRAQSEITTTAGAPSATDLQALNFYLQQQDQDSADAEMRRLRAKFPGWTPPTDLRKLSITQPSTEIDAIYRQIAAGQLQEARGSITSTQAEYPGWTPPAEMLRLLETAEGQLKLDSALDAGNASEALQIASATDGLLRCDRVNNAWRIAKAQEAQQATAAALGTYSAVIEACTNFPDIIATLEKSDTVTSVDEMAGLFARAEARFPDQTADLAALQARLMAGRGAAPAAIAVAPPQADERPLPRPVARPDVTARAPAAAGPAPASAPASGSAPAPASAPAAAAPSRAARGSVPRDPVQCLSATEGTQAPERLAQRGWCAYDLERPMEALAAFQQAQARLSGASRRDARFGMALSYLKMNMTEEAAQLAATTDFTPKQRLDSESIILDQRGVLAFKKRQYRKAIGYFDALESISGHLRRDLAMLRGYSYLNSGDRARARAQFELLNDQLATDESRAGLEASY